MPEQDKTEGDTFTKWLVLFVVADIVAVSLIAYFAHWHWLSNLWFNYGWSSDKGNGPEAIQQTILYALAAVLLIPWVRRALARRLKKVEEAVKSVHDTIHLHHIEASTQRDELAEHLHHLTHHLQLPKFEGATGASDGGSSPQGPTSDQ